MNKINSDFDSSFQKLEEIVAKLELGEGGLEENLKLYEEGTLICKNCREILDKAKLKIELYNSELKDSLKKD